MNAGIRRKQRGMPARPERSAWIGGHGTGTNRTRVQARIFVTVLSFLLHRAFKKKLKAAGLDLSATQALTALKSARVVEIDLGK